MLLLYVENITPRLKYIIDFFSNQLFDDPIRFTTDISEFERSSLPRLNYSKRETGEGDFYIQSTALLFESDIRFQQVECFEINFYKAFFQTQGDLPFDIFAATFYLISRYEEYLPHQKDQYGRYWHINSLAFREKFLHQPLVNIWMEEFKKALLRKFPGLLVRKKQFKCIISYDIDMAYAYLYKGITRNLGGLVRSLTSGEFGAFKNRIKVLRGKKRDPFDCYEWLDALHLYCRVKPYYFFFGCEKDRQIR